MRAPAGQEAIAISNQPGHTGETLFLTARACLRPTGLAPPLKPSTLGNLKTDPSADVTHELSNKLHF